MAILLLRKDVRQKNKRSPSGKRKCETGKTEKIVKLGISSLPSSCGVAMGISNDLFLMHMGMGRSIRHTHIRVYITVLIDTVYHKVHITLN